MRLCGTDCDYLGITSVNVLVTGGAGYVGTVLVQSLLSSGHAVRCLDPRAGELHVLLGFPKLMPVRCEGLVGDLRNETDLEDALSKADAVVHLAAIVGSPACEADPERAWSVNVEGTHTLLRAVPKEMPLIFLSTCSVYGQVSRDVCREGDSVQPMTVYGKTKLCCERMVLERGGVALRSTTAFGASPRFRDDLLVHTFARLGLSGQRLDLFEPNAVRSFVHVADIARAIVFALDHSRAMSGQIYNIGADNATLTKIDLARRISKLTGLEIALDEDGFDPDGRDYQLSFERIESIGFRTAFSFDDALRHTVDWMRAHLKVHAVQ
jgi:nucleoside-diphosphate-sugar epimerase